MTTTLGRLPFPLRALACFSLAALAACGASEEATTSDAVPAVDTRNATVGGPSLPASDPADGEDMASAQEGGWVAPASAAAGDEAAPAPAPAPDPTKVAPPAPRLPQRGVNLAGAEFGSALPGKDGVDYKFPSVSEVDYFVAKGMNTFRLGFKWERIQPQAYGAFVEAYASQLDALVAHVTEKGATAILNPHNFARYYGTPVGSAAVPSAVFADFWSKMATRYGQNPRVVFNLVNEPSEMATEQWVSAANAAIAAIRATGATQVIHAPGNGWTGAHSWYQTYYGTPNAIAMKDIVDPADNVVFEVHQYLDATAGGKSDQCVSATEGRVRLAPFVQWLRENGKRGFVGELAGGDNGTCRAAIDDMMAYMMESADVLDGWAWWAAGPRWGNYPFSIAPVASAAGYEDRPLMSLVAKHLAD